MGRFPGNVGILHRHLHPDIHIGYRDDSFFYRMRRGSDGIDSVLMGGS